MRMLRRAGEAGFTLIEIMVVVFILGLLVTLVAPRIVGRTDEARKVKAVADVKKIEEALHLYKLDNGIVPDHRSGPAGAGDPPRDAATCRAAGTPTATSSPFPSIRGAIPTRS